MKWNKIAEWRLKTRRQKTLNTYKNSDSKGFWCTKEFIVQICLLCNTFHTKFPSVWHPFYFFPRRNVLNSKILLIFQVQLDEPRSDQDLNPDSNFYPFQTKGITVWYLSKDLIFTEIMVWLPLWSTLI